LTISVLDLAWRTRPGGGQDCGAVVARITAARGIVTWHELGWFDAHEVTPDPTAGGPLHFEFHAYRRSLTELPEQAP
jgi:hypothetical protein